MFFTEKNNYKKLTLSILHTVYKMFLRSQAQNGNFMEQTSSDCHRMYVSITDRVIVEGDSFCNRQGDITFLLKMSI